MRDQGPGSGDPSECGLVPSEWVRLPLGSLVPGPIFWAGSVEVDAHD